MIRILLSNKLGELKMTQADLARMTGIRPNTINELYNEFAERVNLQHLDLICEALNCDLSKSSFIRRTQSHRSIVPARALKKGIPIPDKSAGNRAGTFFTPLDRAPCTACSGRSRCRSGGCRSARTAGRNTAYTAARAEARRIRPPDKTASAARETTCRT